MEVGMQMMTNLAQELRQELGAQLGTLCRFCIMINNDILLTKWSIPILCTYMRIYVSMHAEFYYLPLVYNSLLRDGYLNHTFKYDLHLTLIS